MFAGGSSAHGRRGAEAHRECMAAPRSRAMYPSLDGRRSRPVHLVPPPRRRRRAGWRGRAQVIRDSEDCVLPAEKSGAEKDVLGPLISSSQDSARSSRYSGGISLREQPLDVVDGFPEER